MKKSQTSIHIYFTKGTYEKLRQFVEHNFGGHRALSMIVQKAVEEYLERQKNA